METGRAAPLWAVLVGVVIAAVVVGYLIGHENPDPRAQARADAEAYRALLEETGLVEPAEGGR